MTRHPFIKGLMIVIGIGVLVFLALLAYALMPTKTRDIPAVPGEAANAMPSAAMIDAGRYVATAADCIACHTAQNGKPFAGGRSIASPIGNMYSSNITPDKTTGIGNYTLADFNRAVRHGIRRSGETLYPSMPYPSYAKMTDDDLRALYAYMMHGVEPVLMPNRANEIRWPLSIRWPLAIWRKTFAPTDEVKPPELAKYNDTAVARGAYLVQSLGHCGACHTPRASTLQEAAMDDSSALYLSGGPMIDGWLAVNLRGNMADGLGRWSAQDIADTLRKARNSHSAVIGTPMADVVTHSMQNMTDQDVNAIAAYLKTLTPSPDSRSTYTVSDETAQALRVGHETNRGAQLYLDNCAACHRTDAKSNAKVFPALSGNPTVLAGNPESLIRLVLAGSKLPSTKEAPSPLGMPGFGWRLSDDEIAQLLSFVRQSWGNQASTVAPAQVMSVRKLIDKGEIDEANAGDKLH